MARTKKHLTNSDIVELFKQLEEIRLDSLEDKEQKISCMRNFIIQKSLFLVYKQARRYLKLHNYDDLIQEGTIGLIQSVYKYDYKKCPNFFQYADRWILHRIRRSASRFDVVYNPDKNRVVYSEINEDDYISDTNNPEDILFEKEKNDEINSALYDLSDRDRDIVSLLYGFSDYTTHSLREVGPICDMTHERVRQIKNRIVYKLGKNKRLIELAK